MSLISLEGVSKRFGERVLFENVTIGLDQGQKVALVGVNGSGKTTLMKILAGLESADTGQISKRQGLRSAYLPQVPTLDHNSTVLSAVFQGDSEVMQAVRAYEAALADPAQLEDQKGFQQLVDRMDSLRAWDYEQQVKEILGMLNIHRYEAKIGELSGGQRKRVALANLLISEPDVLVLDEPTNHLDIEVIEWLEHHLSQQKLTLFLVTHDRYFLDKVCNEIVELENRQTYRYRGNYGQFLEKKSERIEQSQLETSKARNLLKKELEWLRRQLKARGTKAKYRVDQVGELQKQAHQSTTKEIQIAAHTARMGKKILEIKKVTKAFDEQVLFSQFSYVFKRKERVGIVGNNGTGKSTFLNTLTGSIAPDSGELDLGINTQFGYYRQQELLLEKDQKVIDYILQYAEVVRISKDETISIPQFLTRFGFPPPRQQEFISKLSGGEKRRLQLLEVLVTAPNFLILDEPTNDLDIITLNILEEFLSNFEGCLLLVSHDRYFLDRLVDHLFVFEGNGSIRDFPGNYTDYRLEQRNTVSPNPKKDQAQVNTKITDRVRKLSFKERREMQQLEKELSELESKKEELLQLINTGSEDHEQMMTWSTEFAKLGEQIDVKELRWLELSEIEN